MKFGHFDDGRREYVIYTPFTPFPWINYLGCEDFFSLISNTAGGYAFYKDARLRRITRYRYNDVPIDANGRYFYIKDGDTVWNPGGRPSSTPLDAYECRHGLGYTIISGMKNGVRATASFLVPLGQSCELHKLVIKNETGERKSLKLFSLVEFCLWNALDDMTNFQRNLNTGEVLVDESTIYHITEYRERRNHFSFYSVNTSISGFDTDRDSFTGTYGSFADPETVRTASPKNSIAQGWSPIASHCLNVALEPYEEKSFVFILGYVENEPERKWLADRSVHTEKAKLIIERFGSPELFDAAKEELAAFWEDLLSRFSLASGEERLDRMVNVWNQYQCMVTYNLSRSASYFESGIGRGIGFRDTCQDILGCVQMVPERVRTRLLDVAATQFTDGGAFHQFQPLSKQGNADIGGDFNDDPLWLILGTSAYIKETGDISFLFTPVPFYGEPHTPRPMFEHLKRAFHHVTEHLGPHGLPLIGRADWNDCLNLNCFSLNPDESFQTTENRNGKTAESVFIAGLFVFVGPDYAELARRAGFVEEASWAESQVAAMTERVIRDGWDGEWYLRAYDDAGEKVGSALCEEGKIFIEPQGFCSMARIGEAEGLPRKALASVKKYLDTEHGIVLLDPPYSRYSPGLGEISSYPPGYKENGGIFCHNNPWIVIAEVIAGNPDQGFEYYKKICPAYIEEKSDLHKTEPYIYSQMIAGKAAGHHGEAKNSWLTGTAAWNYVAVSQWILGIRPDFDGLIVDPRLPGFLCNVNIVRKFRGSTYHIDIRRRGEGRKVTLRVNGIETEVKPIPPGVTGCEIFVEAEIG